MTQKQSISRALRVQSVRILAAAMALGLAGSGCSSDNDKMKMTWFGISNWGLSVGDLNMVIDGYVTRIPADYFSGGGGGLGLTKKGFPIDHPMVDKMHGVLARQHPVKYLFTGHSHFDHSFDTPYWAKVTGAMVIGSQSTCFQTQAMGVAPSRCVSVYGGEQFALSDNVNVVTVLWNHSGTHEQNPEQHDAVELTAPPKLDADGNMRGGVAEDFPNGGGNRGYLFRIQTSGRTLSMFFTNSGSTQDIQLDTIVAGKNYGSPLGSLSNAMATLGLSTVDLWIGGGGEGVARYVVPVLRPKYYIPNHLGDFFQKFDAGYDNGPFKDSGLSKYLDSMGVKLLPPVQYMDRFDLTEDGVFPVVNHEQKMPFGFTDIPLPHDAGVDLGSDTSRDAGDATASEASTIDASEAGAAGDSAGDAAGDAAAVVDVPQDLVTDAPRDRG